MQSSLSKAMILIAICFLSIASEAGQRVVVAQPSLGLAVAIEHDHLATLASPPGVVGQSTKKPVLAIQFGSSAVVVTGATANGKVVLFGVARELTVGRRPIPQIVPRATIVTSSPSGTASFDIKKAIPKAAIWVAMDIASGAHVTAPSTGYQPTLISITSDLVQTDSNGQRRKIQWQFAEMELLLVRPGIGAWQIYAPKYSALDDNHANESALRVDIGSMQAVGSSPAVPSSFTTGDVIAVIDPRWMQYGILEVQ